jgi:hypothetical protein
MMWVVCSAILFGVVGPLIAVPVAVCTKVTLQQYYAEPIADTEPNSGGCDSRRPKRLRVAGDTAGGPDPMMIAAG